jgi:hypothetical protein
MANSWSFLFDELNMDNLDFWVDDGISLTGNPNPSSDTINLGDTVIYGGDGTDTISFQAAQEVPMNYFGAGEDTITFDIEDNFTINLDMPSKRFKYSEERILKELTDYISATYNQHYSAGDDKVQTLDLIEACGDGESFCRSNILKYASRYDKKGTARRDIMKILHYAVLLMHFNDKNAQRETYPQ